MQIDNNLMIFILILITILSFLGSFVISAIGITYITYIIKRRSVKIEN